MYQLQGKWVENGSYLLEIFGALNGIARAE